MDQQNREPLTEDIREEKTDNVKEPAEQAKPVPVYAERAETVLPEADGDELKALALSYARYLAEHDMKPGDPTFTDSEDALMIDRSREGRSSLFRSRQKAEAQEPAAEQKLKKQT